MRFRYVIPGYLTCWQADKKLIKCRNFIACISSAFSNDAGSYRRGICWLAMTFEMHTPPLHCIIWHWMCGQIRLARVSPGSYISNWYNHPRRLTNWNTCRPRLTYLRSSPDWSSGAVRGTFPWSACGTGNRDHAATWRKRSGRRGFPGGTSRTIYRSLTY